MRLPPRRLILWVEPAQQADHAYGQHAEHGEDHCEHELLQHG